MESWGGNQSFDRTGTAFFMGGERLIGEFLELREGLSAGRALVLVKGHGAISS